MTFLRPADKPPCWRPLWLCLCLACSTGATAWGIEIKQNSEVWGFNRQILPDRFNILTVTAINAGPEPFEGMLELQHGSRISRSGEIMRVPVYLAPGEERFVQFYPYLSSLGTNEDWTVTWPKGSYDLRPPREYKVEGKRVGIWLEDARTISNTKGGLPGFSADLFPPFSTATDTLQLVAIDEAPRWDQPRRQAFMEWLYRGGELHLYHDSNGAYPPFTGELSVLNSPLERQPLGQGVVIRHPQRRGEGTSPLEPPKPKPGVSNNRQFDFAQDQIDSDIQRALRKMVDPQHLWPLIWVMAGVYLLCVFPGAYLLGRKTRDYRLVFALEFGIAILFSWGFSVVGRRGYNETSTNSAVALARPVSSEAWDVTLLTNVFVTTGGDYDLSHPGRGVLFATGESGGGGDRVRGYSQSGTEAVLHVDIPPFSSRFLRCKAQVKHPGLTLQLAPSAEGGGAFELIPGPNWPKEVTFINALQGGTLYTLKLQGQRFVILTNNPVQAYMDRQPDYSSRFQQTRPFEPKPKVDEDRIFQGLQETLLRQAALEWNHERESDPKNNLVRALIFAPMPEPFFVKNPRVGKSAGRVMYVLDLTPSGAP
ncbi:MAG: hypothetical protein U0903_10780 [Planctomycetales bacterium]